MKYQKMIFSLKTAFCILLLAGCCKPCLVRDDFELALKWAYHDLHLAHMGLEYPPRKEILESCWKSRDRGCLDAYLSVQQGKKIVLNNKDIDPNRTLSFTLDTICKQCDMALDHHKGIGVESECIGAVTALYFFNSEDEDKIILNRLEKASPLVLDWVLDGPRAEWFYNRPDPERWIDFVNNLPDETIEQMARPSEEMERSFIADKFKTKESEIEPFGLMLCD